MAQEEEAMDLCETSQVEVVVTSCEETNGIDQPVYDVEMDHASDKPETSKLEQELTQIPEVEPKHVFEIEPKPTLVTEPVSEAEREQEPTAITDPASMVEKNPASIIETKMIPVAMAEPTFTEKEPVAAAEEPVAAAEKELAAAAEKEPAAAAEKEPATAAEKEPATAAEKEPATVAEKEPATAAEKEPATVAEKEPAAAAEKEPAAAAEKEPATAAEKEPATAVEKEPAAAAEKEPATAAEKESVAGASEAASASEKASFSTTAEYSATAVQHEAMDMDVSSVQGTCEADDISDRTEREQEPTAITNPASMIEKNPASINQTKMIPVATVEPTFTAPKEPMAAAEKEPVAAAEKEPVAAAEKEPVAAAEKEPVAAAEKEPVAAAEKEPVAAAEKEPVAAAEKEPVAAAEKEPVAAAEKEPATAAEKESVACASEAASASEKASFSTTAEYSATAVQHEAMDMDVSSVQGTCEADDISDRTEREQEPTAITNPASMIEKNPASINQTKMIPVATVEPTFTAPKEPMAAAEKEPVAAAEKEPVAAAEKEPVAAAEKEPVAAAEKEPVAAAEKEPVAAAEKEPVAAAEKEPVAAADKEPVAAADKEPVAGASEAASASEKASFSTTAQDSVTAVQHEAMDTDVSNVQGTCKADDISDRTTEMGTDTQTCNQTEEMMEKSDDQQMNENEQALEPCEEVEEPAFPKTLEEFGYYFNEDGQLRSIENDEPFQFVIKEHDHEYNQQRYEALGEVITEYVYKLLEEHVKLERKTIPVDASNDEPQGFFFMSPGALEKETLLLLIHGSGVVRAGQWSRKLIINNDLEKGTQLPYIKSGLMNKYGVIVLNTNQNSINGRLIRGSESPENHALYVWDHFVLNSSVKHLAVVAHSYGGIVTTHLADHAEGFRKYAFAIAFTDSVHGFSSVSKETKKLFQSCAINWVSSNKPLDTELHTYGDCKRLSAGHQVHEWTSYAAMESVFGFIEEKYKNIEKDNGKNKKQCTFI